MEGRSQSSPMIGKIRRAELPRKDPDLAPGLSAVFRMLPQVVASSASTPASNAGQPWCSKVSRPARRDRLFMQTPQSAPKMPASTTTVRVIAIPFAVRFKVGLHLHGEFEKPLMRA